MVDEGRGGGGAGPVCGGSGVGAGYARGQREKPVPSPGPTTSTCSSQVRYVGLVDGQCTRRLTLFDKTVAREHQEPARPEAQNRGTILRCLAPSLTEGRLRATRTPRTMHDSQSSFSRGRRNQMRRETLMLQPHETMWRACDLGGWRRIVLNGPVGPALPRKDLRWMRNANALDRRGAHVSAGTFCVR